MHHFKKTTVALIVLALVFPQEAVVARAADVSSDTTPAASFRGAEVGDDFILLKLSTAVPYNAFMTKTPPRLILELIDTKNDALIRSVKGRGRYLAGVRSSQFQKTPRMITRVVLDLIRATVYKITKGPEGLIIRLAGSYGAPAAAPTVAAAPSPVSTPPPAPVSTMTVVTVPVVPIPTPVPQAVVPVKSAPAKDLSPAAAFKRSGMEGKMKTELVASVESEDAAATRTAIPKDTGDEASANQRIGGRIYTDLLSRLPRDPITFDFDGTDVRDVIRLLAFKAHINIIYGADVDGTLTLHLQNVPFNEAFRTVLSIMQLSTYQVGDNVLRVITPAALTAQRSSASTVTKVIPLNYAKAANVKTTIDSVRQAEGRSGNSSVDSNTNSIVVTESLEGMLATENLIKQLDQRPRQVLIEAKLIEVNVTNQLNYGIQWDYENVQQTPSGINLFGTLTNPTPQPAAAGSAPTPTATTTPLMTNPNAVVGVGASGRGLGVGLSADRVFGALTLGRITNNYFVSATLTAAASQGKAKVLSDPKIATLNNQAANINVTTQIPYVTSNVASTGVQTQSVSYVTTGIQLTVTPSINADGRIMLIINPNVSQPSATAAANTQTGAPAVDSRTAQTSVLVRDGETIVIGGLISDSLQDTVSKIPLLGDIPILGWLFKKQTKQRVRNELLIFVTTHVLPD